MPMLHLLSDAQLSTIVFAPRVILKPEQVYIHNHARVDSFCKIEGGNGVWLDKWVHCASFCHLNIGGGELVMQEGSSLGSGVRVITGSNVHGYNISCSAIHPTAQFKRGKLVIERNAVVFAGATITPGCTSIGVNAVIAAGAVVTKPVPDYEIWAGVPARKIGDVRNELAPATTPAVTTPTVMQPQSSAPPLPLDVWVEAVNDWDGHDR